VFFQLDNGEFQTPIVVLSLAIASSPPAGGDLGSPWDVIKDVQMSPQQADNFFHEMGHAIHSILGQTKFQHVAGI
jgi:intermediate peptidase